MNTTVIAAETLEPRALFSFAGGAPYTGFANQGQLKGYAVLAAQDNGDLVAAKISVDGSVQSPVLLNPYGGLIGPYNGAVPSPAQPAQTVQSDGKYVVLKDNALTRYNKNGTVDPTFGVKGTVTNFYVNQPAKTYNQTFSISRVAVSGTTIYVAGVEHSSQSASEPAFGDMPIVERLTSNGHVDTTFGAGGIAVAPQELAAHAAQNFTYPFIFSVGSDHNIYYAFDHGDDVFVDRFTASGQFNGEYYQTYGSTKQTVTRIVVQRDHKVLILLHDSDRTIDVTRLTANFQPDASFGDHGSVGLVPANVDPNNYVIPLSLTVRNDGVIFASGYFSGNYTAPPYAVFSGDCTFALWGGGSGTAAISGHFYNDTNHNGNLDKGEAPLPYWAAYLDTNNNGVWDAGETMAYSDYAGYFKFFNLQPGTYIVREVRMDTWTRSQPAGNWPGGSYKVTLNTGQLVGLRNFGNYHL